MFSTKAGYNKKWKKIFKWQSHEIFYSRGFQRHDQGFFFQFNLFLLNLFFIKSICTFCHFFHEYKKTWLLDARAKVTELYYGYIKMVEKHPFE